MTRLGLALLIVLALSMPVLAQATKIATSGTLPTHCTVGNIYLKTGAAAGLYTCLATDTWTAIGGIPGGADTQVQVNEGGVFGGNAGFIFDKSSGTSSTQRILSGTIYQFDQSNGLYLGADLAHAAGSLFSMQSDDATDGAPLMRFSSSGGTMANPSTVVNGQAITIKQYSGYSPNGTLNLAGEMNVNVSGVPNGANVGGQFVFMLSDNAGSITNGITIDGPSNTLSTTGFISAGGAIGTGGSTPAVANVGANSCGTTAAAIAGNDNAGTITVGATSGSQCRVTFVKAATTRRECTVTDETTTIATRATYVDVSNTDFLGSFGAGDQVSYVCFAR